MDDFDKRLRLFEKLQRRLSKKGFCQFCGHLGKEEGHGFVEGPATGVYNLPPVCPMQTIYEGLKLS